MFRGHFLKSIIKITWKKPPQLPPPPLALFKLGKRLSFLILIIRNIYL